MNDHRAQKAARATAAQALHAAFPHLVAAGDQYGKNDALNAAAKNIRIELKRAFPKVKFSVRSERFSMGDAIRISWTDGPTTAQVDEIADRYTAGSFDAMQDMYVNSRSAWKDAFGDAKYISTSRTNSPAAIASAQRTVLAKFGQVADANYLRELIWQTASRRTWALNKAPKAPAMVEPAAEVVA